MQLERRFTAALGLAALLLLLVPAQPARAAAPARQTTIYVRSVPAFEAAVARFRSSGGRIVLLRHRYLRQLVVGPRSSRRLTVVGVPGARAQSVYLNHSQAVTLAGLTVSPLGLGDSLTLVQSSSNVVLTRMRFTAAGTRFRSEVDLDHSAHVRVVHSVFSHCGDRSRQWTLCLRPVWASFVDIEHNWFHDCQGCDFIHGFAGESLTIMHNRFNRALRCPFKWEKCFHQDMIELFAANGIRVSRNRFGVSQFGGAQLYLTGAVNHVRVFNNLFKRRDPRVPGIQSHVGIVIGARTSAEVPQDVEIINNTILSGRTKPSHKASSIVLAPRYGLQPVSTRPLVANNILGRARSILVLCRDIRSIKNVMLRGYACSASDQVGPANLDNQYRPTPASTLLLGQADAALAPSEDIVGHRRIDPEIGCYEFEGGRL